MKLIESMPLFQLDRQGISEIVINGVGLLKSQGESCHLPGSELEIVSRSLLKPWQFLAADVSGDQPCWALGMASHSGQPQHLEALKHLFQIAGVDESELKCPASFPMDADSAAQLKIEGAAKSPLFHPCSGKHLFILMACKRYGYSPEDYLSPSHPVQNRLREIIAGQIHAPVKWVTDSCGLPSAALAAKDLLQLWENFSLDTNPKVSVAKNLWRQHPNLIGGDNRLDSSIVKATKGRVLAKEGADGLLFVQSLPNGQEPAQGCLIKLSSGYNSNYLALGLLSVLTANAQKLAGALNEVRTYLQSRQRDWVPRDQQFVAAP